jgi:segregation and condensation protein B
MEERLLKAILESLLFAAGEPVSLARLGSTLESEPRDRIRQALAEMETAYLQEGRGIVLEEIAGGYQLRTPIEYAPYVRRLLSAKPPRLSRPLLETLAIIAYRRQVTRPEIEQLRGVDTGGVIETLLERSLIRIAGRKEAPGRPIYYETTHAFLELFGLKNLEELPDLEEFRAIEGTLADVLTSPDVLRDQPGPAAEEAAQTTNPPATASDSATANADSGSAEKPGVSDDFTAEHDPAPQPSARDSPHEVVEPDANSEDSES